MQITNALAIPSWRLEDFNQDSIVEDPPAQEPINEDPDASEETAQDEWTDGYIHAARSLKAPPFDETPHTVVLNALQEMEARLFASLENSAVLVARLILEALVAHGHERWAGFAQDHIERMANLVRPALMSTMPQVSVRSSDGGTISVSATNCHDDAAGTAKLADHITLCWHLGKAEAGWTRTLKEMASALAPLIIDLNLQAMEAV